MPIFRYFFFVGSALIALLFAADLTWPSSSTPQAIAAATMDQPLIRIRSDRHLPDRVVLDTNQRTVSAPAVQTAAVAEPAPPAQEAAPAALVEPTAKVRDTFAQVTPAHSRTHTARRTDSRSQAQAQLPQSQTFEGQDLPRRKVARSHPAPQAPRPMMRVAQQPHFGLFDATW